MTQTLAAAALPGAILHVVDKCVHLGRPVMLSYLHDFLHARAKLGVAQSPELRPHAFLEHLRKQYGLEPNSVTFCLLMEEQLALGNANAVVELCHDLRACGLKQTGWANTLLYTARKRIRTAQRNSHQAPVTEAHPAMAATTHPSS